MITGPSEGLTQLELDPTRYVTGSPIISVDEKNSIARIATLNDVFPGQVFYQNALTINLSTGDVSFSSGMGWVYTAAATIYELNENAIKALAGEVNNASDRISGLSEKVLKQIKDVFSQNERLDFLPNIAAAFESTGPTIAN